MIRLATIYFVVLYIKPFIDTKVSSANKYYFLFGKKIFVKKKKNFPLFTVGWGRAMGESHFVCMTTNVGECLYSYIAPI